MDRDKVIAALEKAGVAKEVIEKALSESAPSQEAVVEALEGLRKAYDADTVAADGLQKALSNAKTREDNLIKALNESLAAFDVRDKALFKGLEAVLSAVQGLGALDERVAGLEKAMQTPEQPKATTAAAVPHPAEEINKGGAAVSPEAFIRKCLNEQQRTTDIARQRELSSAVAEVTSHFPVDEVAARYNVEI